MSLIFLKLILAVLIPGKNIKSQYRKPKSIKYLSPYLEPLPMPDPPWTGSKNTRMESTNVKIKKVKENLQVEKDKNLQEYMVSHWIACTQ